MLDLVSEPLAIMLIGLAGGTILGLAARIGRFCTLGMIEDVHFGADRGRFWMWVLALGTAMAINFGAEAAGIIDLSATTYLLNRFTLAGAALGGLMFGYGMAQAGNCGFGMLARLGGGDLRAMVIALVMGVTAFATISGPLSGLRARLFPITGEPDRANGLAHLTAGALAIPAWVIGGLLALALLAVACRALLQARQVKSMLWGAAAGAAISSGFLGTFWVATHGFEPWTVQSHTFTAPIGDTIRYAMFSSALVPNFGIGSVLGVILGGFIGSLIRDGFRWEACDDPRELKRQMGGAALMGVGAVIAAGCSVGQGLSALSLLSVTSPVVAASIWIGAWLGLRHLIMGLHSASQI